MKTFDEAVVKAAGPCPVCGKSSDFWYNDVPLRAFCWGSDEKQHSERRCLVPSPEQPYGETQNVRWRTARR